MMIKQTIAVIFFLFIAGCGGGGGGAANTTESINIPVDSVQYTLPDTFKLAISDNEGDKNYECYKNNIWYCLPGAISNDSGYILAISDSGINYHSYHSNNLSFSESVDFSSDSTTANGKTYKIQSIDIWKSDNYGGVWRNSDSYGLLGEVVTTAWYDGQSLAGYDSQGCSLSGTVKDGNNYHFVEIEKSGCALEGAYFGVLSVSNNVAKIIAASSDNAFFGVYLIE